MGMKSKRQAWQAWLEQHSPITPAGHDLRTTSARVIAEEFGIPPSYVHHVRRRRGLAAPATVRPAAAPKRKVSNEQIALRSAEILAAAPEGWRRESGLRSAAELMVEV
jgi:hypothetical protein